MRLILFILFTFGYGNIIYVDNGDFSTIQSGIDASSDGDTVVVYHGLNENNIIILGRLLYL